MTINKVACALIILISMVYKTHGIRCYYCNSANNSACLDVMQYDEEERARIVPVVACETAIPAPVNMHFFCRKIVQTIFHTHRENELRVTRGCGWVPHQQPCYNANNQDHLERVCQCSDDYCNSAEGSDPAASTLLFLALAGCLYFYR